MRRSRAILAWIAALAILLAGPIGSLAECLRCPPDCPMHAPAVAHDGGQHGAPGGAAPDAHAHHGTHPDGEQAGGAAVAAGAKKCHEAPAPAPEPGDGPCLSGVCGHMDLSLARVLPDAVLRRPAPLAPVLASVARQGACQALPPSLDLAPPTEPPRTLSA